MKKQNWDFKKISLKDLILWDKNPRTFDKNSPNPNQKEIISRYQADKLLRIAKNILKYQNTGLQPGELTVVPKGEKFVVFDGNRRISAYKVLLNPELATERKDKFVEFSKQISFTDKKQLWFNIAPDIKSALSRIDDLHNDNFHENWNPTAKTNFALLNIDGQIKELKKTKTHLKRDSLYKKIKSFSYDENVKKIINNPNKFKITSLERIVDSSIGKEYLNYDFNEKGEIVIGGDEKKFDKILKKIAEDVALGNADSRKQHSNEQKETYLKNIFKFLKLNKEIKKEKADETLKVKLVEKSKILELISRRNSRKYQNDQALEIVKYILVHFDVVAEQLKSRHKNRPTLDITDEYDVQDLLHALLSMFFDDVANEEWNPSDGASPSRADFLLMDNGSIIEVKTTLTRNTGENTLRKNLEKELNDDLIKYSRRQDCKSIYFFIYDPEKKIKKPTTFERGVSSNKLTGIKVFTIVNRG